MKKVINKLIDETFGHLLMIKGFVMEESILDEKYFGNEIVTYKSDYFRIRFVNDRGYQYVDISPSFDIDWNPLDHALELVGETNSFSDEDELKRLTALSSSLQKHYDKLILFYNKNNYGVTKQKLSMIEKKRAKEMFSPEKNRGRS